ncbi:MAG: hypothetical protein ACC645_22180 [Pirellulales bacterium]
MDFRELDSRQRFLEAWSAVEIVRPVAYPLFTFGESVLPYYLVCEEEDTVDRASVTRGEVRIDRPMILTADSALPELRDFFETQEEEGIAQFLLARTARFSNLRLQNQSGTRRTVDQSVEATVEKLGKELDDEEEDRVAILTAPRRLAGVALLRYAAERIWQSGPDNIQELRERGFLP